MEEFNFKIFKNNLGIGLVEAVLAIAFAVVVIVAVLGLINFNLQSSTSVSIRQEAFRDQSRVLETLKLINNNNLRGNSFLSILSPNCTQPSKCSLDETRANPIVDSCNTGQDLATCFSINKIDDSQIRVELVTYFKIRGQSFSTPLSTVFTDWR